MSEAEPRPASRVARFLHRVRDGRCDVIGYSIWTRLRRLDLAEASQADMGIDPSHAYHHSSSGGPDLVRVLRTLDVSAAHRVVDLGSGKGGAMFTMSRFPFSEILGIELSERMIRIARDNAARLGVTNVHFVCGNAATFTDLDRFTHIYLANPFPPHVVRHVIRNLAASVGRRPRHITLIYYYPGCPDEFVDPVVFSKTTHLSYKGSHAFHIYTTRSLPLGTAGSR